MWRANFAGTKFGGGVAERQPIRSKWVRAFSNKGHR